MQGVIRSTVQVSGDASKLVLGHPAVRLQLGRSRTTGTCPATAEGNISLSQRDMVDLAARRGATPEFDQANYEMTFTYELPVDDGATSCTQSREVHYVDANGAQIRMQDAIDGGFRGVSLFALGYEDAAGVERHRHRGRRSVQPAGSTPTTTAAPAERSGWRR